MVSVGRRTKAGAVTVARKNQRTALGKRKATADLKSGVSKMKSSKRVSSRTTKSVSHTESNAVKSARKGNKAGLRVLKGKIVKKKMPAKPRSKIARPIKAKGKTQIGKSKQVVKKSTVKTPVKNSKNKSRPIANNTGKGKATSNKRKVQAELSETAQELNNEPELNPPPTKKLKTMRGKLNPRPQVTLFDKDPTFYSKEEIPKISTIADSRLLFRAIFLKDQTLLKKLLTTDASCIYSLCLPISVTGDNRDVLSYAIKLQNKEAVKLLLEADVAVEKKFGSCPDILIKGENTGDGYRNRSMFGHALKQVTVGRGGKEGNAAFLKDEKLYTMTQKLPKSNLQKYLEQGIADGMSYSMVETFSNALPKSEGDIWNILVTRIDEAVRKGNIELAGKLVAKAMKTGGHGFNSLHEDSLTKRGEPFSDVKPISVVKKSQYGSRITPLHCAAINPDPYYLEALLNSRPEYTVADRHHWQPIHYAAVCEGDEPLKLLLKRGVATTVAARDGYLPLHLAVVQGRLANVKALLEHEMKNPGGPGRGNEDEEEANSKKKHEFTSLEKGTKNGLRPIHLAAQKGHLEILKVLLEAGADVEKFTPAQAEKLTPFMIACQYGHMEMVKFLVNHGVKMKAKDRRGRTAIFHAVMNGHAHVVSYLLRLGVDHDVMDSSGNTLAHYAAAYGWYFNLKLLLEAGCDVVKGNAWKVTPLVIAFMKGHLGIVEMLVKQPGVDINSPVDADSGMTLLHKSCFMNLSSSMVPRLKFLIDELGADCQSVDFKGNNALHYLADRELEKESSEFTKMVKNLTEGIKYFIDRKCSPASLNLTNNSPFSIACAAGNFWIAEKFIDLGVKLTPTSDSETGTTVLHEFAAQANSPHIKHLYEKLTKDPENLQALKVMANMRNKKEETPLLSVFLNHKSGDDEQVQNICNFVTFLVNKLGGDVNAAIQKKEAQTSVLHCAVATSYFSRIISILRTKALNIDPLDCNQRTPLALTLVSESNADIDTARSLIAAGANVNFKSTKDDSLGLLLLLAMKKPKMYALIPDMIIKGADFRECDPKTGNSILHFITKHPEEPHALECIQALIEAGANVNSKNLELRTPLHLLANARGKETDVAYDIEDLLLSKGANMRMRDARLRTPLHYVFVKIAKALDKSHLDPIELVMVLFNGLNDGEKSEFLKIPDQFGSTVLHYAAMRGATICCTYFTSQVKGSVDFKDMRGNTPFGLAVLNGHEGCSLHFHQIGAKFLEMLDTNVTLVNDPNKVHQKIKNNSEDDKQSDVSDTESSASELYHSNSSNSEEGRKKDAEEEPEFSPFSDETETFPKWNWDHITAQTSETQKSRKDEMKYTIFQEVVKRDWQGLLHLMIAQLLTAGANISVPVSTALKTSKFRLALKLIHRVKSSGELIQPYETLLHTLAREASKKSNPELQVEVFKALMNKGVKPNDLDDLSTNAICYAAMNQNPHLVTAFAEAGLSPLPILPDKLGRTPFSSLFWKLDELTFTPEMMKWGESFEPGDVGKYTYKVPISAFTVSRCQILGKVPQRPSHLSLLPTINCCRPSGTV